MKIELSPELKAALDLRHRKIQDGHELGRDCDRIKAALLHSKDWSIKQIAQALRLHEATISRHIDDFLTLHKLTSESDGSHSFLNAEQTQQPIEHICDVTYLHTHQIVVYIKATFQLEYTVPGLNKRLHQHQFSYMQPKGVPHKFEVDKQTVFIEHYEQLKDTLRENEPLLFMDFLHPTQASKITSGWIRKGVDKLIKTTGSCTRLNIEGAIRLEHIEDEVIEQYDKTVNGGSIVNFLTEIQDAYRTSGTIYLVLDGAGYHRSGLVIEAAKKQDVSLHF
jgi:transposase